MHSCMNARKQTRIYSERSYTYIFTSHRKEVNHVAYTFELYVRVEVYERCVTYEEHSARWWISNR